MIYQLFPHAKGLLKEMSLATSGVVIVAKQERKLRSGFF